MSRSRHARRGTRAAVQRRPTFGEEFQHRLGGPTPQVCRAIQGAEDRMRDAHTDELLLMCDCAQCLAATFGDDFIGDEWRPDVGWWEAWQARQAS